MQCRFLAYGYMFVVCSKTRGLFVENVHCSYVGESSIIMYLNGQCSDQKHQFPSSNCNTSISQLSRFHHMKHRPADKVVKSLKLGILGMTCR